MGKNIISFTIQFVIGFFGFFSFVMLYLGIMLVLLSNGLRSDSAAGLSLLMLSFVLVLMPIIFLIPFTIIIAVIGRIWEKYSTELKRRGLSGLGVPGLGLLLGYISALILNAFLLNLSMNESDVLFWGLPFYWELLGDWIV